ncbi:MAG: alanine racemase [Xanthobacteraceae bacterium]
MDTCSSIVNDTIVEMNCFLHVRGNLLGNLTVEPGAQVIVDGSVGGKINNRGGKLVINHKELAAFVDGPPEAEAGGVLKINLTAIAANWDKLAKTTQAECAAVVKGNAYGCGIDPIAGALAKTGCKTFFVSNIPEARRVRAVAPNAIIYVLNGLYSGMGPVFAEINARPVINNSIEMAEWDLFARSQQWTGGCALNVDTGASRLGLSPEEAAALAPSVHHSLGHGITLLMSRLDTSDKPTRSQIDRQISLFHDLRRLFGGVPASLANSSGIFVGPKTHFDLVRPGAALYGVNPTPNATNPMAPVIELRARIVQVLNLTPGQTIAESAGWMAKRRSRVALVSTGYADGYRRSEAAFNTKLQAIVGNRRCPVAGHPSMDLLPIDVTDLPDPTVARLGQMVTLIGPEIGIDEFAAATKSTGREVLSHFGSRFHRIYYAN